MSYPFFLREVYRRAVTSPLLATLFCIAALASGIVSETEKRYYFSFSFTGQIQGVFEIYSDIGKGFSEPDVSRVAAAKPGEKATYKVALPSRTIYAIRLDVGQGAGAGVVEDVSVVDSKGSVYRAIPLDLIGSQ